MKLDKILVPLDGSMLAETALPAACGLAAKEGAAISLLRAAEVTTLPGADWIGLQIGLPPRLKPAARDELLLLVGGHAR